MKKLPEATQNLVAAMREHSPKWDAIVEIIQKEKSGINKNVLDKMDDNGTPLTPNQIDQLITWYQFLDYVITLPEVILEEAKPKPESKEPNMEVYPLKAVRAKITK